MFGLYFFQNFFITSIFYFFYYIYLGFFFNTLPWSLGATKHLLCEIVPYGMSISSEQRCNFNYYKISPTCACIKGIALTVASSSLSSLNKLNSIITNMLWHWNITCNYFPIYSFPPCPHFLLVYVFFFLFCLNCLLLLLDESKLS